MKLRGLGALLAVGAVGLTPVGAAGTAAASQVTLGSTSGTPSANICPAMIRCTYLLYQPLATNPYTQVPFDGTVTSFSVNSGSAGNTVWLRVLRLGYHGLGYLGAGTSPPQKLNVGLNTFTLSLPVKAGDVIGLDNDSSALIFDASSMNSATPYYMPALADGATAGPNQIRSGYRLLLSATVQSSSTTTPSPPSPTLTNISQSHRRWRAGSKLATFAAAKKPPVGTTFRFTLNTAATVSFAFSQLLPGRKVNGKCVAQTAGNRTRRVCQRSSPQGSLSFFSSSAGPHRLSFQGRVVPNKKLGPGTYTVTITATNAVGGRVARTLRSFTIVPS